MILKFIIILTLIQNIALADTTFHKDALSIFMQRCSICHNYMPDKDWRNYNIAKAKSSLIMERVWVKKDMPQGNATGMTDQEREVIKNWIDEGSKE